MAGIFVPNQIIDCEELSTRAKLVYVYLLRLNPCCLSYKAIARKCGMSRSTAFEAVKELIAFGAIVKFRGGTKTGKSNSYQIRLYDIHLKASNEQNQQGGKA